MQGWEEIIETDNIDENQRSPQNVAHDLDNLMKVNIDKYIACIVTSCESNSHVASCAFVQAKMMEDLKNCDVEIIDFYFAILHKRLKKQMKLSKTLVAKFPDLTRLVNGREIYPKWYPRYPQAFNIELFDLSIDGGFLAAKSRGEEVTPSPDKMQVDEDNTSDHDITQVDEEMQAVPVQKKARIRPTYKPPDPPRKIRKRTHGTFTPTESTIIIPRIGFAH